jgi:LPXTG-motif cell wall-anchored protein
MSPLNPQSSVSPPRPRRARVRAGPGAALFVLSLFAAIAVPGTVAGAATTAPVTVKVSSATHWTSTGITVTSGESVTINASGDIHFGPPPIADMTPLGRPPVACANQHERTVIPFPAPTLNCWSLIGRIGTGPPFAVGTHKTITAAATGALQLGINDNRLQDNTGSWTSTTSVTPGGTPPASTGKSSSNTVVFVIIGLVVVLLLGALFFLMRRRRGGDEAEPAAVTPAPAPADAPADVNLNETPTPAVPEAVVLDEPVAQPAESVGLLAKMAGPLGTSVAPAEGEVADTNIFEVEVTNGTDLRVGYNYFPEDTNLRWQVRQGTLFAHGQFPTNGGGNMYHYVTLPLGVKLEPGPASVDVQFTWAISGVPFRYSVRRDPGV